METAGKTKGETGRKKKKTRWKRPDSTEAEAEAAEAAKTAAVHHELCPSAT